MYIIHKDVYCICPYNIDNVHQKDANDIATMDKESRTRKIGAQSSTFASHTCHMTHKMQNGGKRWTIFVFLSG